MSLSLRDHFAGIVLTETLKHDPEWVMGSPIYDDLAAHCYTIADAMLKESIDTPQVAEPDRTSSLAEKARPSDSAPPVSRVATPNLSESDPGAHDHPKSAFRSWLMEGPGCLVLGEERLGLLEGRLRSLIHNGRLFPLLSGPSWPVRHPSPQSQGCAEQDPYRVSSLEDVPIEVLAASLFRRLAEPNQSK